MSPPSLSDFGGADPVVLFQPFTNHLQLGYEPGRAPQNSGIKAL